MKQTRNDLTMHSGCHLEEIDVVSARENILIKITFSLSKTHWKRVQVFVERFY